MNTLYHFMISDLCTLSQIHYQKLRKRLWYWIKGSLPCWISFSLAQGTTMSSSSLFPCWFLLRWFILLTFAFSLIVGQFPRKCLEDLSISKRRCCPIGADGSPCNAMSGRGKCAKLKMTSRYKMNLIDRFPDILYDDRFMWPLKAFKKVRWLFLMTFFCGYFVGDDFVSFVLGTSVSSDSISSFVLQNSQA